MTCKARKSNGEPCGNAAIKGGKVCRAHGGGAPQVREAARLRLLMLVDPALARLGKLVRSKYTKDPIALAAIKDVLDRAGLKTAEEVTHTGEVRIVISPDDGRL